MSGQEKLARDVDIDIAGLFQILKKKSWLLALIPLLTFVGMFVLLSFISPRYEAVTQVLIEDRESSFTRNVTTDQTLSQRRFDKEAIGSLVEVMKSDAIALSVIKEMKPETLREFADDKASIGDVLTGLLGRSNRVEGGSPEEQYLKKFRKHLTVFSVTNSRVIVVKFWSKNPEVAKNVSNAIASKFLENQKRAKLDQTEDATLWLGPQIKELQQQVREAENKVAEYRSSNDLLDGNNNALLATQQLSEVSSELSRLRAERASALAKVASIKAALKNGGSLEVIPEVIASPLIQRLRESEVALQAEISELSTTLLPNHPRLKALKSQLGNFKSQITAATRNILKSLENNVGYTKTQEQELRAELNRLKSESSRVNKDLVQLREFQRIATTLRLRLDEKEANYKEAVSRNEKSYSPVNAKIFSAANLPSEPYFPKIVPFSLAAALAAFILSVIGLMSHALLTGRALKPVGETLADQQPMPVVGMQQQGTVIGAPANDTGLHPEYFSLGMATSAIASFGNARIAAIAPGGDEGSIIVPSLARNLALTGASVVVVDLSSTGVSSAEMLGREDLPGVRELLSGTAQFTDVFYQDQKSNVHIMPTGVTEPADNAAAMQRLSLIVDAIDQKYQFVVLDCGFSTSKGVARITNPVSPIVISGVGAQSQDVANLTRELQELGLVEIVPVLPDTHSDAQVAA